MNRFFDDSHLYAQSNNMNSTPLGQVTNNVAYEKDVEYMKQSFSSITSKIQSIIDDECDKLEYEGSFMFDEFPDKNSIQLVVSNILQRLDYDESVKKESAENSNSQETVHISSLCDDDALSDCVNEFTDNNEVDDESHVLHATTCVNCGPWGPPPPPPGPGPWGPPPPPPGPGPWGPPPPPPGPGPFHPYPCFGPSCPWPNRPCGPGKFCPLPLFPTIGRGGEPNFKALLIENMLNNEFNYRRNRYRSRW